MDLQTKKKKKPFVPEKVYHSLENVEASEKSTAFNIKSIFLSFISFSLYFFFQCFSKSVESVESFYELLL